MADPKRRRRFEQEAPAASKLEHPNIAVIHEIDEFERVTFIAMELSRGEKLSDRLAREKLPIARAVEMASEIPERKAARPSFTTEALDFRRHTLSQESEPASVA